MKKLKLVMVVKSWTHGLMIHRWVLYLSVEAAVGKRVLYKLMKRTDAYGT